MLPISRIVKCNARTALKNKWPQSIAVCLILIGAIAFCTVFTETVITLFSDNVQSPIFKVMKIVATLLCIAIIVGLAEGCIRWFWFLMLGKEIGISEVFYYYSSLSLFLKPIILYAHLIVRTAFLGVICFLPFIVMTVLQDERFYGFIGKHPPIILPVLWPLYYLFLILGAVLFILVIMKYSLSPAILVINEDIYPVDAISISVTLSSGNRCSWFGLFFSFVGWVIISAFGVTLLYTLPFFLMSYTTFARFTVSNYRLECSYRMCEPLI